MKRIQFLCMLVLAGVCLFASVHAQNPPNSDPTAGYPPDYVSGDTVIIHMAALDQPFMYNRMGAAQPTGMIFALERDIVSKSGSIKKPGNVKLREGKRPRPIVLRANQGDILMIHFTNYLRPFAGTDEVEFYEGFPTKQQTVNSIYPATREAGVHILGMELVGNISDDGSFVGSNASSLADPSKTGTIGPGQKKTYVLFAPAEGSYILHSTADNLGDGTIRAGQISNGLFGSITVQPPKAEWYRSQVTELDLYKATKHWVIPGNGVTTQDQIIAKPAQIPPSNQRTDQQGFPVINYDATYLDGTPILKMYKQTRPNVRELVHTDLTAIITGSGGGYFPLYENSPSFNNVPASPNRRQPYREFSIHYHEAPYAVQAFPEFYDNVEDTIANITKTIQGGVDQFAINYGTGGIGAEIFANRIEIGPMGDCIDCAYEEFFLSSWPCGDPAQVVDVPTNAVDSPKPRSQSLQNHINETLQDQMLLEAHLLDGLPETAFAIEQDKTSFKATKVFYPDDPSNVYHSYMNDHVKFRINHGGAGITHVHHQHAHQWLHSPNSDKGHYLDSQTINPGASYTLEMVHSGSGNLNKTVGDQIFHCHFYPHFAQGMWSLWRVHDVLETGTVLDNNGIPITGSRALPDGEIDAGVPIPGLVPLPELPMAPVPGKVSIQNGQIVLNSGDTNPGYPFFIPGVSGQRPPHPPLDFAIGDAETLDGRQLTNVPLSGGLPRSVIIGGARPFENHTKYDWTKITDSIEIVEIPEEGTYYEKVAMLAHATRVHHTVTPEGKKGNFLLNGLPPQQGAPFADPAVDANGIPVGTLRRYKAANIQVDAVLNKQGWHYPQQRPIVLWGDVASTVAGERPPEPFFMRANSGEYIEYWHTNLVPEYYELDDFQVRTPTDVIGQHIHLVKFDVTSSDGAANGFNYEDGTLAPNLVTGHIDEINRGKYLKVNLNQAFTGSILDQANATTPLDTTLVAYKPNPIWGDAPGDQCWNGAQTTIQRWYSDPLYDNEGKDRTLRTVFTHDHFGPSTHQQIGLYAGLLIEPNGSEWLNSSTGTPLGFAQLGTTRDVPVTFTVNSNGVPTAQDYLPVSDGGPTDWNAIIETVNEEDSYREFMFEFQDNQQAYLADSRATGDPYPEYFYGTSRTVSFPDDCTDSTATFAQAISFRDFVNENYRGWIDHGHAISPPPAQPGQFVTPELVTTGNRGTLSLNYRNAPIPPRVYDNGVANPDPWSTNSAFGFSSLVTRNSPELNSQPTPGYIAPGINKFIWPEDPLSPDMQPGDPYTPLVRAYEGDKIQFRTLVGAHVNPHFFNIHGIKWFFEPSFENSGFRSTQMMSLSEHFEMNFFLPNTQGNADGITDYLYVANADQTGIQNGIWGLMRAYDGPQDQLAMLSSNNDIVEKTDTSMTTVQRQNCGCPVEAPVREYDITAISVDKLDILGPNWGKLIYNERYRNFDSKAIIFLRTDEVEKFEHSTGYEPEPLVLRASAGECVKVTLRNSITKDFVANSDAVAYTAAQSEAFPYTTSYTVGLTAELLSYDVSLYDGTNVGLNEPGKQTLDQDQGTVEYQWYAGQWNKVGKGIFKPEPVEFGSCVLSAPDPLEQYRAGLFGAIIIEPEGSYWVEDCNEFNSYTSANVYASEAAFNTNPDYPLYREFVLIFQDNLNVPAEPIGNEVGDNAVAGLNYKSEPLASRLFKESGDNVNFNQENVSAILSNLTVLDAPETPTFVAKAGTPVRFRVLHPGGVGDGIVFDLHGHVWQEEPYTDNSTKLGYNPLSQWIGARGQLGALNSFDLLIRSAGGKYRVPGDYLYRDYRNQPFQDGVWGLFTVTDGADAPIITRIQSQTGGDLLSGDVTVDPNTGFYATDINLSITGGASLGSTPINQANGEWIMGGISIPANTGLTITTTLKGGDSGGTRSYTAAEVAALSGAPKAKVIMRPVTRSSAKQVEPGVNPR